MVNNMDDNVQLTPEQREAISEIDRNLQIIACAGSGKTEVITRRIANILQRKSGIKPENIVAFTFTEKAADSMKKRIAKALNAQDLTNIGHMYVEQFMVFAITCSTNIPSSSESIGFLIQ